MVFMVAKALTLRFAGWKRINGIHLRRINWQRGRFDTYLQSGTATVGHGNELPVSEARTPALFKILSDRAMFEPQQRCDCDCDNRQAVRARSEWPFHRFSSIGF